MALADHRITELLNKALEQRERETGKLSTIQEQSMKVRQEQWIAKIDGHIDGLKMARDGMGY